MDGGKIRVVWVGEVAESEAGTDVAEREAEDGKVGSDVISAICPAELRK